ncbi:MAG: hypothetical protein JSU68_07995 [Phycisphaerales bacterium]|nr:MAG: hypothetical protein JSU68_07995 [Phycisphaerales bacterium]
MSAYFRSAAGRTGFGLALVSWASLLAVVPGVQGAERTVLCEEFTGPG